MPARPTLCVTCDAIVMLAGYCLAMPCFTTQMAGCVPSWELTKTVWLGPRSAVANIYKLRLTVPLPHGHGDRLRLLLDATLQSARDLNSYQRRMKPPLLLLWSSRLNVARIKLGKPTRNSDFLIRPLSPIAVDAATAPSVMSLTKMCRS